MQLSDIVRCPFFVEELHALFWSGSARLGPEARRVYDQYLLLSEFGIRPWEVSGQVCKEDLAYMMACARFRSEAEGKWDSAGR